MPIEFTKKYKRERIRNPNKFEPRSFRTKRVRNHLVVVGCPKGYWDENTNRCRVGTQVQTILHPKHEGSNPHFRDTSEIRAEIEKSGDFFEQIWNEFKKLFGMV